MSVEGPGALVSHIEPHVLNGYAPVIAATKARLMKEAVGEKFAEFGYRGARNGLDHAVLMMALKVGGDYEYTSNDEAVYLFGDNFTSIGTVGHEYIMAYQRDGLSLEEAQEQAFRDFIEHNEKSALLPDIIDTIKSGLPMVLKMKLEYSPSGKIIMPRFDSGDILGQQLVWKKMSEEAGVDSMHIVEDGYTPEKGRKSKEDYAAAGGNLDDVIVGAGGYFQNGNTRDAISFAYKRTSTKHENVESSIKFSDSPGKLSLPGPIRVYEQGSTLIVAKGGEEIDGNPLYVPLLQNGRISYFETLEEQAARADQTWNRYDRIEYSPEITEIIQERTAERDEIKQRL
jgi:nicotinic acid phosphoribosyltransferase